MVGSAVVWRLMANTPPFLHGVFYLVEFQGLGPAQTVHDPKGDLSDDDVITSAVELMKQNFKDTPAAGTPVRINGPIQIDSTSARLSFVEAAHLRDDDDGDDLDD